MAESAALLGQQLSCERGRLQRERELAHLPLLCIGCSGRGLDAVLYQSYPHHSWLAKLLALGTKGEALKVNVVGSSLQAGASKRAACAGHSSGHHPHRITQLLGQQQLAHWLALIQAEEDSPNLSKLV